VARASGRTILSKLIQLIGLLVIAGVLAAGFLLPYIGGAGLVAKSGADKFLNTSCNLTEEPVQQKTTMYASDGKTVIATLFDQNRQVIPFKSMPKDVINALIATEDRRFYSHHGVDMRGLLRGALKTTNGDTQGASTLTEQYVKQVRYYEAATDAERAAAIDQNIDRKILDARCALKIETQNSKTDILQKYLNIAFFGENAYGIQTAAQTYFGVNASRLTIPEAAMLVGLVKAPSDYDPFEHPQAARDRRDLVLDNMASQNYITTAQADAYKAQPIKLAPHSTPARGCAFANPRVKNVGFFCDYALDWLENTGGLNAQRINTAGYKIITTLDANLQTYGQNNIWTQSGLDASHGGGYILAMPSVTPSTGAVTSMITDVKYGVKKGDPGYSVDHLFTKGYAGSGSTYKYFTALTALKLGVPTNYTLTTDNNEWTTKNCPVDDQTGKPYTVHNAGNYSSTMPLDHALPASSNTYFVAMEDQTFSCELGPIVNTALGLGMNQLKNHVYDSQGNDTGRTIAQSVVSGRQATFTLGQDPTSVLELTGAFSAVANDGVYCPPIPIRTVTDINGKPVPFKRPGCSRQFDPYTARTLVNIMTNDTHSGYGTADRYFADWYANGGSLVAGKTGTNNSTKFDPATHQNVDDQGNSALWFVGITPSLVSAAALVNPLHPNQRISNVPGITDNNDGTDTFGATASRFWLMAYQQTLQSQQWTWPTADSAPGEQVPSVTSKDVNDATTQLTEAGYKVKVLSTPCGSSVQEGNVAFYGPHVAEQGATITLCESSGVAPTGSGGFQSGGGFGGGNGNGGNGGGGNGNGGGGTPSPSSQPTQPSPSPKPTKPHPSPTKKHP
jgi:membrane peptidoglycan carboxypeptidase